MKATDVYRKLLVITLITALLLTNLNPVLHPASSVNAQESRDFPETNENPLSLKMSALAQLGIINGSGSDKIIFDQAMTGLNNSVNGDYWDKDHLKNPLAFSNDVQVVGQLQNSTAYVDGSNPDHQAVINAIMAIVQSNIRLANISISDDENASQYIKDPLMYKLVDNSVNISKKYRDSAEYYLEIQNTTGALEYYKYSWAEANIGLLLADANTTPTINVANIVNDSYTNSPTINISGAIDDVAVYSISNTTFTVNGKPFVVPLSGGNFNQQVELLEGVNEINITVIDQCGNTGFASIQVILDTVKPIISISGVTNGKHYNASVCPIVTIEDANPGVITVSLDGFTYTGEPVSGLGIHTLYAQATDLAGNMADVNMNFFIDNMTPSDANDNNFTMDTVAPVINISNIEEGKCYNHDVTPNINVSDDNLNFTIITLNGKAYNGECISGEGFYTLYVYAEDMAGNNDHKTINFSIDKTLPMLSVQELTLNPTLNNPQYNLTGSLDVDALLTINGVVIPHGDRFNYSTSVVDGVNVFIVNATDANGNVATWNKTRLVDSDKLPDYYEINVTHTDPLNGDTDGNSINDSSEDFDNDLLSNYAEYKLGTNPFSNDTDTDGLNDLFEALKSDTSPLKNDTLNDGINDSLRDPDHDGLTNFQEQALRTNPRYNDSDGDTLKDGDEVNVYHTSPLYADIDNDSLPDNLEIAIGSGPSNPDSDRDGILDGDDSFIQSFSNDTLGVSVQITGSAYLQKTLKIQKDEYPFASLTRLPGVVGDFIDISAMSSFESATIRLYYDESRMNGSNESDLKLYYFDENSEMPVEAPDQQLDTDANHVEARTDHLGVWFICDNTRWATFPNSNVKQSDLAKVPGKGTMGMASADMQAYDAQSSDPMTFDIGDKINIRAQVHNDNSDIDDDILVSFYEGNPDTDGINIGNVTITGGIPYNSSKTAILYNYTIQSDSVDIYVKVDPLDNITEFNESNNLAYQVLHTGSQDSDDDGLPDIEELGGMYDIRSHSLIYTYPYDNDTDGDGLNDSEEMGPRLNDSYGNIYYEVKSYPDYGHADSDGDGLTDGQEVNEHPTIQVVDSYENATRYANALPIIDNPANYLHFISVTSDPLKFDTDSDGINDSEEIRMRTNPGNNDTDGDHIYDNLEEGFNGDPTIFDLDGPEITIVNFGVYRVEGALLKAEYDVTYMVNDPAGLSTVTVLKDGIVQQPWSFTDYPNALGATATFYTDWVDSIIDEFEATRVDVNAVDRWGNDATKTTYRPSMWGQLAEALSGSFLDPAIALNLGMMDGLTCALYQVPELVYQLLTHPVETLQMLALFALIPEAAIIMIIPAIYELEEGENPYDLDTELQCHLNFAAGWVQGYVGMSILLMFAGKQVMEGIGTTYSRISEILPQIEQECGDIPTLTGKLKYLGIRGATLIGLIKRANAAGVVDGELLYTDVEVGAAQAHVWQEYEEGLTPATRAIVDEHKPEGGALLKGMTPSGIDILNSMDGNTLEKILSFQWSRLSEKGVLDFQAGLFKAKRLGASDIEISDYIDYAKRVEDVSAGSDVFVKKISTISTLKEFQSLSWEAERAAYWRNLITDPRKMTIEPLGKQVEFKVIITVDGQEVPNFIECKRPDGGILTDSSLRNILNSGQDKFFKNKDVIGDNPAILEIDARNDVQLGEGLPLEERITDYMNSNYENYNYIKKVKIFLDGQTRLGTWDYDMKTYTWENV